MKTRHHSDSIIQLFNDLFKDSYRTILVGGGEYPFYQASKSADTPHQIIFREDYFASAMHEVSHWCLAGERRRTLDDYGYWYSPDGRTQAQQIEFEKVEIKPQALEALFAEACRYPFTPSADNLSLAEHSLAEFSRNIQIQKNIYLNDSLPNERAKQFHTRLIQVYSKSFTSY